MKNELGLSKIDRIIFSIMFGVLIIGFMGLLPIALLGYYGVPFTILFSILGIKMMISVYKGE